MVGLSSNHDSRRHRLKFTCQDPARLKLCFGNASCGPGLDSKTQWIAAGEASTVHDAYIQLTLSVSLSFVGVRVGVGVIDMPKNKITI